MEAGLQLTRAGGPSALVLRDVTRRVGVSPNAAYRHFADRAGLLQAVVERVQQEMTALMHPDGTPDGEDPAARARAQLRAVGLGYIDFALREPGWFELAFAAPELGRAPGPGPGSGYDHAPGPPLPAPLARLVDALDGLVAAGVLRPEERPGAEWPCWSAVHGFALLALHGPLRGLPAEELRRSAERTVDAVVRGVTGG
nr:TetR/AcrR family transcriptional regulator [Auraticoccus cholistanensis]